MAPRTRRSKTIETANNTLARNPNPVQFENSTNRDITPNQRGTRRQAANTSQECTNVQEGRKRTISSAHTHVNTTAATHTTSETNPTKRARNTGPPRARPLQLRLLSGDGGGTESQLPQSGVSAPATAAAVGVSIVNNRRPLQRMPAFYGELPHEPPPPAHCDENAPSILSSDSDTEAQNNSNADTEPDDDQEMMELAQNQPSKFQEALRLERPSWRTSGSTLISLHTSGTPGRILRKYQHSGQHSSEPASMGTTPKTWPPETELVISGKGKLNLSSQKPAIRIILQDAIEEVRAALLIEGAFPDPDEITLVTRDCISTAAKRYGTGTLAIQERLESDNEYLTKMASVPRLRIPLFRHKVKEYCDALVLPFFLGIKDDPNEIISVVAKQVEDYHYIYPKAPNTASLVLRNRPYRNDRIITILRDMYFSGGTKSFATRFESMFLRFNERDGTTSLQVPVPMLALVATALYAAIYEWRQGVHRPINFTSEAYIDVYRGNYNTIKGIKLDHENAYHRMMSDIYSLASDVSTRNVVVPSMPTASIDFDTLEE